MRHLKNRKKSIKTESSNEKIFKNIENKSKNFRNLKIILLLSWILPFIAVFIIHLSKLKLPEKTKKIVCKILNMNFSVILTNLYLYQFYSRYLMQEFQELLFISFLQLFLDFQYTGLFHILLEQ